MSESIEPPPSFRSTEADKLDTAVPSSESDPTPPKEQFLEQNVPHKEDKTVDSQAPPPLDIKALTDRTLSFLATASNETLGACLVGLGASTYLVLGRVGLLLIGVVGGVVLHATWEGHNHGAQGDNAGQSVDRRRELGIDIARRVLDWRKATENSKYGDKEKEGADAREDSDLAVKLFSGKELDYSGFRPETAAALTELTDAVIRDYVKYVVYEIPFVVHTSNLRQMVVRANSTQRRTIPQGQSPNLHSLRSLFVQPSFAKASL